MSEPSGFLVTEKLVKRFDEAVAVDEVPATSPPYQATVASAVVLLPWRERLSGVYLVWLRSTPP